MPQLRLGLGMGSGPSRVPNAKSLVQMHVALMA